MRTNRTFLLLATIWFIFTTFLLCIPGKKLPTISWLHYIPHFDKFVHISIFLILSFLFCKAINHKKWFGLIAFLCSFYGMIMEFVQKYYIPNRSFDIWDIAADTVGSFAAIILINYLHKKTSN